MGTLTDILRLYKPDFDETNYNDEFATSMDRIDMFGRDGNVMWVHPDGDDADSGRTPADPKKHILAAYDDLPGTGGSILIADGSRVGGEVAGQGIWLLGGGDPNYSSPPAGWRQVKRVAFMGIPGTADIQFAMPSAGINGGQAGGAGTPYSGTDKPLVWLSGTNTPLRFKNLSAKYVAAGLRLGVRSDDLDYRTDGFSQVWFQNINISQYNTAQHKDVPNPAVDVGYVFWLWFDHCVFNTYPGYPTPTPELDSSCSFVFRTSAPYWYSPGLIEINDCTVGQGGARFYTTGATPSGMRVKNLTQEGSYSPTIQLVGPAGGPTNFTFDRVENADAIGSSKSIVVDPGAASAESVVVINPGSGGLSGPMTVFGRQPDTYWAETEGAAAAGRLGVESGKLVGPHDGDRRSFGFTTVPWATLANSDMAGAGSWTGGATVTTGQAAPDGTNNAAKFSGTGVQQRQAFRGNRTFAVGDWVFIGVWCKGNGTAPVSTGELSLSGNPGTNVTFDRALYVALPYLGDGEWHWLAIAGFVTDIDTQPTDTYMALLSGTGKDRYYYAPMFLHIPAGTFSTNQLGELASALKAYPPTAVAGMQSLLLDQSAHIPRGYIEIGEMSAPGTPAANFLRLYAKDSSGTTRLFYKDDGGTERGPL